MQIVSVNVGQPRTVVWHGRSVSTGIYKTPLHGRVAVRRLNLDGDGQADLSVHGGEQKAVYCYPTEYYDAWTSELGGVRPEAAMFGENLTTSGVDDQSVHVGDRFAIGSTHFVVTQPRLPCYKLGIRFQDDNIIKLFLASGRTGFYLAVLQEGDVGAGDPIVLLSSDPRRIRVAEITRLFVAKRYHADDVATLQSVLGLAALPESWKEHFRHRLARHEG